MVGLEGFEPPTHGLGNRCSILLSYRPKWFIYQLLTAIRRRSKPWLDDANHEELGPPFVYATTSAEKGYALICPRRDRVNCPSLRCRKQHQTILAQTTSQRALSDSMLSSVRAAETKYGGIL